MYTYSLETSLRFDSVVFYCIPLCRGSCAARHAFGSLVLPRAACCWRATPSSSAARPPAAAPARERLRLRLCVCGGECESELSLGVM